MLTHVSASRHQTSRWAMRPLEENRESGPSTLAMVVKSQIYRISPRHANDTTFSSAPCSTAENWTTTAPLASSGPQSTAASIPCATSCGMAVSTILTSQHSPVPSLVLTYVTKTIISSCGFSLYMKMVKVGFGSNGINDGSVPNGAHTSTIGNSPS